MRSIINGINLAYDDTGSGEPVLLIHGYPLNRHMWHPQVQALSQAGYRVITPDLRGFGESDAVDGPYTMEIFADDIAELLDFLGIGTAVVGGMSMGGYVLLNFLERYPERASAACFIVTRSSADNEAGKARRLALARDVMHLGPAVVADVFEKLLFAPRTPQERPKLVEKVRGWMLENDSRGLAGGLLAMRERKDYTSLLGAIRVPALVIGADKDLAVPAETIEVIIRGLPHAASCILAGGGHLVNLEEPKAFNDCLLEFLRELRQP